MNVIDPRALEVIDWCDRTAANLAREVPPLKLSREDEWREWAVHSVQLLSLRCQGVVFPSPYEFSDWREWAERFNQAVLACTEGAS